MQYEYRLRNLEKITACKSDEVLMNDYNNLKELYQLYGIEKSFDEFKAELKVKKSFDENCRELKDIFHEVMEVKLCI